MRLSVRARALATLVPLGALTGGALAWTGGSSLTGTAANAATTTTTSSTTSTTAAPGTTTTTTVPAGKVKRLAGADRIATAIAISKQQFAAGKAKAVVLARSDGFADALPGTPLAVKKVAPMLLTPSTTVLDTDTDSEIRRVAPMGSTVYILGGTAAVPQTVDAVLTAEGYTPTRLAGTNRAETAVKIAAALGNPTTVLLATGLSFPDALSAGAAAAKAGASVLLTNGATKYKSTDNYLASHAPSKEYAIGGPAAHAYPAATPISGTDRYETATLVAAKFFTAPTAVGIATGLDFPDALAGGAQIGAAGGPLLLTAKDALSAVTATYLHDNKASITAGYVYGGTSAVADATVAQIEAALT